MRILAITNMYPSPADPTSGTFVEQQVKGLQAIGAEVEVWAIDRAGKGYGAYKELGPELARRIQAFRPDLVHVMYGGVMADSITGEMAKGHAGLPVVVSFCGSDLLGEQLNGWVRRAIASVGVLSSHKAARRATGIVVKSRNLRDALPKDVSREKVRIIPNGINLGRFQVLDRAECRQKLGWGAEGFHVLFPTNAGDARKRLWLAEGAVEAARKAGVPAELHQLRGVRHAEVPLWLNASDCVILTSLHEGSPNVVKEALACDVAVVSVDVGDVAERIEGIEGCHIAKADFADLAEKLGRVHHGPGRVAGRAAVEELTIQRIAERLLEFYGQVVSGALAGARPAKAGAAR